MCQTLVCKSWPTTHPLLLPPPNTTHRHARTATASAARVLLVGGGNANDPSYDPRNAHPSEVSGPITRYTVPGTDVFVVDTTNAK